MVVSNGRKGWIMVGCKRVYIAGPSPVKADQRKSMTTGMVKLIRRVKGGQDLDRKNSHGCYFTVEFHDSKRISIWYKTIQYKIRGRWSKFDQFCEVQIANFFITATRNNAAPNHYLDHTAKSHIMDPVNFIKIILSKEYRSKGIRLPVKFTEEYGKYLSETVTLKVPKGDVWKVGIHKSGDEIWLKNGWGEFAELYNVGFSDMLMFKYQGVSTFGVVIFNATASEIEYPEKKDRGRNSVKRNVGKLNRNHHGLLLCLIGLSGMLILIKWSDFPKLPVI